MVGYFFYVKRNFNVYHKTGPVKFIKQHQRIFGRKGHFASRSDSYLMTMAKYNLTKIQWKRYLSDDKDGEEVYLDNDMYPLPFKK